MINKILLLAPALALAGCHALMKPEGPARPPPLIEPRAPAVAGTDLDQNNTEKVRVKESLKAYPVGRLVDSSDSNIMHEAHTVYRREAGANWNLNPNAPTVVPLGPVLAVADPARTPSPLPAELEQRIMEQNQLMSSLIEQNEALSAQLTKLSKEMADIGAKQPPPGTQGGR